jgi:hypothetical protein
LQFEKCGIFVKFYVNFLTRSQVTNFVSSSGKMLQLHRLRNTAACKIKLIQIELHFQLELHFLELHGSLEPFPCLPSHLYLIFFELLKNSLRATVEHYGEGAEYLPPVTLHLDSSGRDFV